MIDIHAHILNGVDDGPSAIEESIEMIKFAMQEGIIHIIATPHYKLPRYDNVKTLNAFKKLLEAIEGEKLEIGMSLGNELYLDDEALAVLDSQACLTLADSKYVLIELPEYWLYPFHEQLLYEIGLRGYRVILAHIERYDYFMDNLSFLREMIHRGYYTQLNASSIVERRTRKKVFELIDEGLVHLIATDCHSCRHRCPSLKKAYELVEARFGAERAKGLFNDNGYNILNDQPLPVD